MPSNACALCLTVSTVVLSCVFVVFGIIGIAIGPRVIQNQVNGQLPLSVGSSQLDSWSTPPVPIYLQFWLWECVNEMEVLQGKRPSLRERGPFTYLEHREKVGVFFNENFTVTYRQVISYTFLRNMSVADELLPIKMINVPMVTIVSLVRNQSNITQDLVNFLDEYFKESLFVVHTAGEWLWGYEDPLLKAAKALPVFGDLVPDDRFGFFLGQNATDDGLYTVFTGADKIDRLNNINKWNGVSSLTFWKTPWANQINGTDGSWFPPLYNKNLQSEQLYLYSTQVCRSLYAKFESHSSVLGIPTETFSVPSEVFLNATLNPDNAGFGTSDSGVLDVSTCNKGAPIYISLPHLLYAADRYQNEVEGIMPNADFHRTVLQVEPHTGLVLSAQKRLQINVFLQADPFFDQLKQISEAILPAMWINESTTIDEKSARDLNNQVLRIFTIVRWVSIVVIVVGAVLAVGAIVIYNKRRTPKKPQVLINGDAHDTLASHDDDDDD